MAKKGASYEYEGISLDTFSEYFSYAEGRIHEGQEDADDNEIHDSYSSAGTVRLSGALAEFPLPYLMAAIYRKKSTGRLVLEGFATRRIFFFNAGGLASAQSDGLTESLEHTLLHADKFTASQRRSIESLAMDAEDDDDFVLKLLNDKVLSEAELQRWVRRQFKSIVGGAFQTEEGTFVFSSTDEKEFLFSLDTTTAGTIVAGLRQIQNFEQINRMLPPLSSVLRPEQQSTVSLADLPLSYQEKTVAQWIDGRSSIRAILDREGATIPEKLTTLHAGLALGAVTFEDAQVIDGRTMSRETIPSEDVNRLEAAIRSETTSRTRPRQRPVSQNIKSSSPVGSKPEVRQGSLPTEAKIADWPGRRVLLAVRDEKWSGVTTFQFREHALALFFEQGRLVYILSNMVEHRMGLLLMGLGHLSKEKLQGTHGPEILKAISEENNFQVAKATPGAAKTIQKIQVRIGQLVLGAEVLSKEDFKYFLRTLMELVVTEILRLKSGTVRCRAEYPPRYPFFGRHLAIEEVLIKTIQNAPNLQAFPFYNELVPESGDVLKLTDRVSHLKDVPLVRKQQEILKSLDGKTPYLKLANSQDPDMVRRFAMALRIAGVVEVCDKATRISRKSSEAIRVNVLTLLKSVSNDAVDLKLLSINSKNVTEVMRRMESNQIEARLPGSSFPLAPHQALLVLHTLGKSRFTGTVEFTWDTNRIILYLKDGQIYTGASRYADDMLCHSLLSQGVVSRAKLSQEELSKIGSYLSQERDLAKSELDTDGLQRFSKVQSAIGNELLMGRYLEPQQLFEQFHSLLTRTVCRAFLWEGGSCKLLAGPLEIPGAVNMALPVSDLVVTGTKVVERLSLQ